MALRSSLGGVVASLAIAVFSQGCAESTLDADVDAPLREANVRDALAREAVVACADAPREGQGAIPGIFPHTIRISNAGVWLPEGGPMSAMYGPDRRYAPASYEFGPA